MGIIVTTAICLSAIIITQLLKPNYMLVRLFLGMTSIWTTLAVIMVASYNWGDKSALVYGWSSLLQPGLVWVASWTGLFVTVTLTTTMREHGYSVSNPIKFSRRSEDRVPELRSRPTATTLLADSHNSVSLLSEAYDMWFLTGIFEPAISHFRRDCTAAKAAPESTVLIYLNSPGGASEPTQAMRSMIRELQYAGKTVKIMVTAECASAALSILTAVPLEHRLCTPGSQFMTHTPVTSNNVPAAPEDSQWYVRSIVDATRVDENSLWELFNHGGDYWFDARKALELGIVGAIV